MAAVVRNARGNLVVAGACAWVLVVVTLQASREKEKDRTGGRERESARARAETERKTHTEGGSRRERERERGGVRQRRGRGRGRGIGQHVGFILHVSLSLPCWDHGVHTARFRPLSLLALQAVHKTTRTRATMLATASCKSSTLVPRL